VTNSAGDRAERGRADLPSTRLVMWVFVAGVLSTGVHYTHNFTRAADYPPVWPFFQNDLGYQVGIALFWPTLTLWGAWGVRQYGRGNVRRALVPLAAWTALGTTSPGHFLGGVPDIPPFAMATIATDAATGLAMLVLVFVALWTLLRG
jgi:hypothetical protein